MEKDGYYYGRGTRDIKGGVAMLMANFIRLRAEGFRPNRDLILLFTADEEYSGGNLAWLLKEHRPLIDAAFALNTDAGQVDVLPDGRPEAFGLQTAEKIYASFALEASSPGGHSSRPGPDNAIYKVARALARVEQFRFPRDLNETAPVYFERWARMAPPELAPGARALGAGRLDDPAIDAVEQSPYLNALIRTTCVATQLRAGNAENALPERARAVVNCRILPQSSPGAVEAVLRDLVAADGVTVAPGGAGAHGAPVATRPAGARTRRGRRRRDVAGHPAAAGDESRARATASSCAAPAFPPTAWAPCPRTRTTTRSHAPNERIRIAAFNQSMEFWYRLTQRLAE